MSKKGLHLHPSYVENALIKGTDPIEIYAIVNRKRVRVLKHNALDLVFSGSKKELIDFTRFGAFDLVIQFKPVPSLKDPKIVGLKVIFGDEANPTNESESQIGNGFHKRVYEFANGVGIVITHIDIRIEHPG